MYTREITRRNRTAFIIAIDQSSSMQESVCIRSRRMTKAEAVAIITDRLIDELTMRARRDDGVRNYYDIAVVGYGNDEVYPLVGDTLDFVPISSLASRPVAHREFVFERILPSGERSMAHETVTAWVEPRAAGSTPLYEMFTAVTALAERWCGEPQNAESFPPIVFNITDGEPTDCDEVQLREAASRLRASATADGHLLLINVHISTNTTQPAMVFPRIDEIDRDNRHARLLADISSQVPESMNDAVRRYRNDFALPPFVAMSYNASITEALSMLDIGSRRATILR